GSNAGPDPVPGGIMHVGSGGSSGSTPGLAYQGGILVSPPPPPAADGGTFLHLPLTRPMAVAGSLPGNLSGVAGNQGLVSKPAAVSGNPGASSGPLSRPMAQPGNS